MMPTWDRTRVIELTGLLCDERITDAEFAELSHLLEDHDDARRLYQICIATHLRIEQAGAEVLGQFTRARSAVSGTALATGDAPTRSVSEERPGLRLAGGSAPVPATQPQSPFRITAIAAVVAFIAVGILAYSLWPRPAVLPVVDQTPAAKIANLTDAKWAGVSIQPGDTLIAGQQLLLLSGSVEITFNSQVRVIVEGPTELTIVDAAACRLADGKLVAHVPDLARGFKVHTPDGTVTDLGTEFGVYVDVRTDQQVSREEEQQPGGGPQQDGKQPPVTEVHVFKGKVDVVPGDQLAQAPAQSTIRNPQSAILSAGQAVTISDNKVRPLPAADPFKFALDKLSGKPRTVLLSDDFETYELGNQVNAIGPWIVQSGTRKGQGVSVEDPVEKIATANATADTAAILPAPPALVGSRVANFGTSPQNSTDTYPVLGREIDGKLLTNKCQVLVEFDFFPRSEEPQLSLALATQLGHTVGIELWRGVDAAKQSVDAAKKVDFVSYRWYRMRVLLSVADGVVSEVRVDRSQWRGPEGWVRELSYQPPTPKLDWSTPPRYAIFGFPVVSPATVGGVFWLDNVRIEVIAEK